MARLDEIEAAIARKQAQQSEGSSRLEAIEAAIARKKQTTEPELSTARDIGSNVNAGIAETAGFFSGLDPVTGAINALLPDGTRKLIPMSELIKRGAESLGIDARGTDTVKGKIAKTATEAVTGGLGLGGLGRAAIKKAPAAIEAGAKFISARSAPAVIKGRGFTQRLVDAPASTLASEAALGAGGGAVEGAAQEGTDNPALLATANILGTLGTGAGLTGLRGAARGGGRVIAPFTKEGSRLAKATGGNEGIVARGLKEKVQNRAQAIDDLGRESDTLKGPGGKELLTSAQKSKDPGLLAAEKGFFTLDPDLPQAQRRAVDKAVRAQLDLLDEGKKPEFIKRVNETINKQRQALDIVLDNAANTAQKKIDELPNNFTKSQASEIVNEQINLAEIAHRENVVNPKWDKLKTVELRPDDYTDLQKAAQKMGAIRETERKTNLPSEAIRTIKRLEKIKGGPTSDNLIDVYKNLGDDLRAIPPGEQASLVRNIKQLQTEITNVLDNVPELGPDYIAAKDASLDHVKRFTGNTDIQKFVLSRKGKKLTDARLTLDKLIKPGTAGEVSFSNLEKAASTPETTKGVSNYMSNLFKREAFQEGKISPQKARRFLEDYKQILFKPEFKELRKKIGEAAKTGEFVIKTGDQVKLLRSDIDKSKAALFLDPKKSPFEVVKSNMRNRNSEQFIDDVLNKTKGDKDAISGLKSYIIDDFNDFMELATKEADGNFGLSRTKPGTYLKTNEKALKKLFTAKEYENLNKIAKTVEETNVQNIKGLAGSDTAEKATSAGEALAFVGAKAGAAIGGELRIISMFSRIAKNFGLKAGSEERAKLIRKAIEDPEVMKTLLMKPDDPKIFVPRLRAHLALIANEEDK